jgi:NAD(P)H-nitrite reductase large subunit
MSVNQTNSKVDSVSVAERTVRVNGQKDVSYDRLLLTTGSRPYLPPEIEGTDASGVFALRTLADARAMAQRVDVTDHAVMLGGGLLNLKAVFALLERGVNVTFDPVSGERIVTGLWTNTVEMGRCAGYNMTGRKTAYSGTFGIMNATQIADEPFVSMGMVHTDNTDYEVHVRATGSTYRKVVFSPEGDRLVGVLFIGNITGAGMYRYVIRENMPIGEMKSLIVNQRLHYGHFMRN